MDGQFEHIMPLATAVANTEAKKQQEGESISDLNSLGGHKHVKRVIFSLFWSSAMISPK